MIQVKKIAFNTMAIVVMGLVVVACGNDDLFTEKDALNNANKVLGITIPANQNWKMTQEVTANVSASMNDGGKYSYTIYSNNPLTEQTGVVLTQGSLDNGSKSTIQFSSPSALKQFYVGLTNASNYTIYKRVDLVDGNIDVAFGNASVQSSRQRAITVNGDTYSAFNFPTQDELTAAFPTRIPADADEVSELLDKYGGTTVQTQYGPQTMWDLYAIYMYKVVKGYNLKITSAGTYDVGGCQNTVWDNSLGKNVTNYYNVYVDVDGEVIINRPQASHFNLYILRGSVKMGPNQASEWSSEAISVAQGATFTDSRDHIAANDGVKLYNRGTVNATNTTKYDIGNFCSVYNEGIFNVSGPLSYSPGDSNTSYFVNHSDNAILTAPSMTMNSSCHFYNDGKVEISGETNVTQARINWINNGHYTTGSMVFSAKNNTFYNYCQLLVRNTCSFLDGEFNLMSNSYTKVEGRAKMDNFIVNMSDNSSINLAGGCDFGRQGDGTYQGFRAVNDNAKAYVRLGGTSNVPVQQEGSLRFNGANMTFTYENLKFFEEWKNDNGVFIYGTETNQALLNAKQDPRIEYNAGNANMAKFSDLTVTDPTETQCAATWGEEGHPNKVKAQVWSYAFEDSWYADYDMNDVVLKVSFHQVDDYNIDQEQLDVTLCCTGASYNLTVWLGKDENKQPLFGGREVHAALGGTAGKFINTGSGEKFEQRTEVMRTIKKPAGFLFGDADYSDFWIKSPEKDIHLAEQGQDPHAIVIPEDWRWPKEWTRITEAYPDFANFANDPENPAYAEWYKNPIEDKLY